jgi:hypothetical protein
MHFVGSSWINDEMYFRLMDFRRTHDFEYNEELLYNRTWLITNSYLTPEVELEGPLQHSQNPVIWYHPKAV